MYGVLRESLAETGVDWSSCVAEDTAAGALVLLPVGVSGSSLVGGFPALVDAAVQRHNAAATLEARLRLRCVLHEGPVYGGPSRDGVERRRVPHADAGREGRLRAEGVQRNTPEHEADRSDCAKAVTRRLLASPELRTAHRRSDLPITFMVSESCHRTQDDHRTRDKPAVHYREVRMSLVGVGERAWITAAAPTGRLGPAEPVPRTPAVPGLAGLGELIEALEALPSLRDADTRGTVLDLLPAAVAGAVPQNARTRSYILGLILTCADYQDGLGELYRALMELEGETVSMRRVRAALGHRTGRNLDYMK